MITEGKPNSPERWAQIRREQIRRKTEMIVRETIRREPLPQDFDAEVEMGAAALLRAFPTLAQDYTASWFRKAAEIVLLAQFTEPDDSDIDTLIAATYERWSL